MATSTPKASKPPSKTDPKAPEKEAEAAPPPAKKRGWLKILLALVLLSAAGGAGAWYFLRGHDTAAGGKPGEAKVAPAKPPVFATLEPFTVNLQQDDASPQFLQVGLTVKVSDAAVADAIKAHTPEIRNRVLLLLSGKKASAITTVEGKQALSAELMQEIRQPLGAGVPAEGIDSVLFTSFVIQ